MDKVLYDPFSLEAREDPYPMYRELRAEAPVYYSGEHDVWVLARFDDVQAAARDWQGFSNAGRVDLDGTNQEAFGTAEKGNMLDSDPPVHTWLRGMVRKLFTPKAIKASFAPVVEAEVGRLLDELEDSERPDAVADFANVLPTAVIAVWLGFPRSDARRLTEMAARFVAREADNPGMPESAVGALAEIRAYIREVVEWRRREPSDDVISVVLRALDAEGRDEREADEIVGNMAFFLYIAGTETTAALIGNALLALWRHPEQRRLLIRQPDLMPWAVEEFIRYDSPLQFTMRAGVEERAFRGVTIPADSSVVLLLGSANRDEERWERSEELDVTREPLRHLGFGEGIHHCLGAPLARLEAPVALSAFLRRWPDYEVASHVERLPGFSVRGLKNLPVRLG